MITTICFIRGINVGGRNKIKMADLRDLLDSLGLRQARTILQSGNAIFASDESDLSALATRIESSIQRSFGFDVHVLLRGSDNFKAMLKRHPFSASQLEEPAKAAIVFLERAPSESDVIALRQSNPGREEIYAGEKELFVYYADGMARSKLTNARIESVLGVKATTRNWNTCQRVLGLLDNRA